MNASALVEVLAAMDVLVFEPVGGELFRPAGIAPNWATRFLSGPLVQDPFRIESLFPFLECVLPDARQAWLQGGLARIKSGIWTEHDADGEELLLEATALTVGEQAALLVARVDAGIRAVIQKARQSRVAREQDLARAQTASQRLEAEKSAAEDASRTKGRYLRSMSHELRAPLNAIIGYSELLAGNARVKGEGDLERDLEKIRWSGRHLLTLIDDMLDLARIEAGRMRLRLEPFDPAGFLPDVAGAVRPLIAKNSNALVVSLSPGLGIVTGDVTKIRQCLINLLSNAAKFTSNGTITLSARRLAAPEGDRLIVDIRDTGIGMTAEQLGRLFEPFAQADAATSLQYGGSGLGLAISRELARLMGGDLAVASVPGTGSVFSLDLPADPGPPTSASST